MNITDSDREIIRVELAKAEAEQRPLDLLAYAYGQAGNAAQQQAYGAKAMEKARLIAALKGMLAVPAPAPVAPPEPEPEPAPVPVPAEDEA